MSAERVQPRRSIANQKKKKEAEVSSAVLGVDLVKDDNISDEPMKNIEIDGESTDFLGLFRPTQSAQPIVKTLQT